MSQSLAQIMAQIDSPYAEQRKLIQQQQAQLAGQETAAISGANAQKDIAFDQVRNAASANGVFYSGNPSEMSNRYVAANYAPAIAGIKSQTLQQGNQLTQALLGIQQNQGERAYGMYNDQMNREQQERQYREQTATQQRQFQQQQAASQAQAKAQTSPVFGKNLGGFQVSQDRVGGFAIKAPNGKPATLASMVKANGGGFMDVLTMLAEGSAGDRKLAEQLKNSKLSNAELLKKYPNIFAGL